MPIWSWEPRWGRRNWGYSTSPESLIDWDMWWCSRHEQTVYWHFNWCNGGGLCQGGHWLYQLLSVPLLFMEITTKPVKWLQARYVRAVKAFMSGFAWVYSVCFAHAVFQTRFVCLDDGYEYFFSFRSWSLVWLAVIPPSGVLLLD